MQGVHEVFVQRGVRHRASLLPVDSRPLSAVNVSRHKWPGHAIGGWVTPLLAGSRYKWPGHAIGGWVTPFKWPGIRGRLSPVNHLEAEARHELARRVRLPSDKGSTQNILEERIVIELMTSDRELKASRKGSKGSIYET